MEENIYLRQVYKQVTEAGGEEGESGRDAEHSQMSCCSFPQDIHNYSSSGTLSLATGQHGNGRQ